MKDISNTQSEILLAPPVIHDEKQTRHSFALPNTDLVIDYLATVLWNQEVRPLSWLAVRLSPAAYIYCEETTCWKVVAKFYLPKTGTDAAYHAEREFQLTQQAREYLTFDQDLRSVQLLALVQNGLGRLIEKWTTDRRMWDYQLVLNHGDATTSNFIFPRTHASHTVLSGCQYITGCPERMVITSRQIGFGITGFGFAFITLNIEKIPRIISKQ